MSTYDFEAAVEYRNVVARFREITGVKRPTGICCASTVDGVPECVAHLPDGSQELTFTYREVELLGVPEHWFIDDGNGFLLLYRANYPAAEIADALHDGWLAESLECGAHPTRPVVIQNRVVGIVAIDDCNTDIAIGWYRYRRDDLMQLWQSALDLVGMKPYYVTWGVKPGWIVL
jgi:hypothetical protein